MKYTIVSSVPELQRFVGVLQVVLDVTHLVVDGDEVLEVDPCAHLDPETKALCVHVLAKDNIREFIDVTKYYNANYFEFRFSFIFNLILPQQPQLHQINSFAFLAMIGLNLVTLNTFWSKVNGMHFWVKPYLTHKMAH